MGTHPAYIRCGNCGHTYFRKSPTRKTRCPICSQLKIRPVQFKHLEFDSWYFVCDLDGTPFAMEEGIGARIVGDDQIKVGGDGYSSPG